MQTIIPTKEKIKGFYSISRVFSSSMIGLAMIVGVFTAGGLSSDYPLLFYVFILLGGTLAAIHAMVYNDILDLEIDRINEPQRPIPSGIITLKEAQIYQILIAILSIISFYLADLSINEINFSWWYGTIYIILADLYSWKLKKMGFIGNIVVAYMSYASFLYGDLIVNAELTTITQGLGIAAFLVSLSREIIKGLTDIEGDRAFQVKTIAVLLGDKKASNFALIIQLILIITFIYPIFVFSDILGKTGSILVIVFMLHLIYSNSFNYTPLNAKSVKNKLLIPPLIISPFVILDTII